jgi:hypothetical protein
MDEIRQFREAFMSDKAYQLRARLQLLIWGILLKQDEGGLGE